MSRDLHEEPAVNNHCIEAVKVEVSRCVKCGRVFEKDDIDYITFEGNVYVGEQEGFIDNRIPNVNGSSKNDDKFRREDIVKTRICISCLMQDLQKIKNEVAKELQLRVDKLNEQLKGLSSINVDIPDFLKER